jgi:hypothetical protein
MMKRTVIRLLGQSEQTVENSQIRDGRHFEKISQMAGDFAVKILFPPADPPVRKWRWRCIGSGRDEAMPSERRATLALV